MTDLVDHEWRLLEMLAGAREWESGAWVNACCEALKGRGYATPMPYDITEEGRKALAKRESN